MSKKTVTVYLYTRFERFWHWVQALMIIMLAVTGLEVHDTYTLFGFDRAVELHNFSGLAWVILYIFIIFWLITTGQWKHYVPTMKKVFDVMLYYAVGIFRGAPHPVSKAESKHNPLQRLVYLSLVSIILPYQMGTGLLYYYYNELPDWGLFISLETIGLLHMAGAFALLSFLVVHIYMTTTGHNVTDHMKGMITGYEEIENDGTTPADVVDHRKVA